MSYGNQIYGTTLYGTEGDDGNEPQYPIPDLMRYLPDHYQGLQEMKIVQEVISYELGLLLFSIEDVLNQSFVDAATWSLDIYESELGLITEPSKPIERRREQVKAKKRGSGTTTKTMIRNAAMAFSGGEVDVVEYPTESRFEIQFIGVKGIPQNMPGFIAMIEQIKPSHLSYSFRYTYTWWESLINLTWGSVQTMTWNQLRTFE